MPYPSQKYTKYPEENIPLNNNNENKNYLHQPHTNYPNTKQPFTQYNAPNNTPIPFDNRNLQNIHYQPQQIINVTQKHKHKRNLNCKSESKENQNSKLKCKQPSLRSESSNATQSLSCCESVTTAATEIIQPKVKPTKYNISTSAFV